MKEIEISELKKLMESSAEVVLLDCRRGLSSYSEHIEGALLLPWDEVALKATVLIPDKNTLIITSCAGITCDASANCYQKLEELGYSNIRDYSGGLAEWKAYHYPTITITKEDEHV